MGLYATYHLLWEPETAIDNTSVFKRTPPWFGHPPTGPQGHTNQTKTDKVTSSTLGATEPRKEPWLVGLYRGLYYPIIRGLQYAIIRIPINQPGFNGMSTGCSSLINSGCSCLDVSALVLDHAYLDACFTDQIGREDV